MLTNIYFTCTNYKDISMKKCLIIMLILAFSLTVNNCLAIGTLNETQNSVCKITNALLKTNKLTDYTWHVLINAYSDDPKVNSINLDSSLINMFIDDDSALSFIIAEQLADQTSGNRNKLSFLSQNTDQNIKNIKGRIQVLNDEIIQIQKDLKIKANLQSGYKGAINNNAGQVGNQYLTNVLNQTFNMYDVRNTGVKSAINVGNLYAQKTKYDTDINQLNSQLERDNQELSQLQAQINNEIANHNNSISELAFNTDDIALEYILRAGLNPDGIFRVLDLEKKSCTNQECFNLISNREYRLDEKLKTADRNSFSGEGLDNFANTKSLSYIPLQGLSVKITPNYSNKSVSKPQVQSKKVTKAKKENIKPLTFIVKAKYVKTINGNKRYIIQTAQDSYIYTNNTLYNQISVGEHYRSLIDYSKKLPEIYYLASDFVDAD